MRIGESLFQRAQSDREERLAQGIVDTIRQSLLILNDQLRVVFANRFFYETFKVTATQTEGRKLYELGNGQWDIPKLRILLEDIIPKRNTFEHFLVHHTFEHIGERVMVLNARRLEMQEDNQELILLAVEDITESHRNRQSLKHSEEKYRKFVEGISSIIIGFDRNGVITFFNGFSEKLFGYSREEVVGKRSFVGTIIPVIDSRGNDNSRLVQNIFSDPQSYYQNESEGIRKDGGKIYFTWNIKAQRDCSGEITEILVDGNDITELAKNRAEFEEKSATLEALLDFIPEGIIITDKNHRVRVVSRYTERLLGIAAEDLIQANESHRLEALPMYWPGTDRKVLADELPLSKSTISGETYEDFEVELRDGVLQRAFSVNSAPILDKWGKIIGAIGGWRDITDRRLHLLEIEQRKQVLDAILEYAPVGIMLVDKDGLITDVSRMLCEYLDMSAKQIVGKKEQPDRWGILNPSTRKPLHYQYMPLCRAIRRMETTQEEEFLLVRNGRERVYGISASPIYDFNRELIGAVTVWRDISERKEFEAKLQASRRRLRSMFDLHKAIMFLIDPETGRIEDANDSAVKFYGFDRDKLRSMRIDELNQLSPQQIKHEMQRALHEERDYFVFPHKLSSGRIRWVEVYSSPVPSNGNKKLFSIIHDVTERKEAQEALRASEERFRGIFDNAALGIVEVDLNDKFVAVNDSFCRMLEYDRDELLETDVHHLTAPEDRQLSDEINDKIHRNEVDTITYEKRFVKKDGSRLWVNVTVSAIRDVRDVRFGAVKTVEDITERKRIADSLRESEERFRNLADNISQLAWMADPKGCIFWYNRRWYDYTGTTQEQMRGWGWKAVHHPDHFDRVVKRMQHSWDTGELWEDTFPLRSKEGEYRWFLSRAVPIRNKNGKIVRWFGTNTDITDMRKAQKEIRVSAERFRRIVSSRIIGIIIADNKGGISFANDYFLNMLGYTRGEFDRRGLSWKEITPMGYSGPDHHALEQLGSSGVTEPYQEEYIKKDGSRIWVLLAGTVLPGSDRQILAFTLDITQQRRTLEEARKRRAEVEAILAALPDGYIIYDQYGKIVQMNDRAKEIIGFTEEDKSRSYEEHIAELRVIAPDGSAFPVGRIPSWKALHGETTRDEIMKIERGKHNFWISASASPIVVDGRMLGAIMEFSDITRLHNLQEQLTSERNFVDAIFQTSGAPILITDDSGKIVRLNSACEHLSGYSQEELINNSFYDLLILEEERAGIDEAFGRLRECEGVVEHENHWVTKSGEKKFIRWRNTLLYDRRTERMYIVAAGIDISDRLRLERELSRRAEELAAANRELESFSYSVSHDLRSPLHTIASFSSILSEDYAERLDEDGREYLRYIDEGIRKMERLINDLLALSHISRQEMSRDHVNLSALVSAFLRELHQTSPQRKTLFVITEDVYASGDERLLDIAIKNLLRNAWKFTGKNDVTRIEFGTLDRDGKTVYFIRDNGVGFDNKFAQKIFEPFKRTHSEKDFGGTGVGLSIVERVVTRHGGSIWAEGKIGEGAGFYFTLD